MPDLASFLRRNWRWVVVAVLVALPIVVLVVSLAQRTWYPTGDQAQAELRMRSLPDRPPLVGAAGRIADEAGRQGNHPGPLMFWTTWPLYALLGQSSWAFEAATAFVNVVWLTVSVWLVQRRAGLAACAWYGVTALVLIGGYGLDGLSQPWNPWVALLPFTVLLLATWSVLEGDRWMPVLAVAAGSYALQGHIGYAPVVLPLVALSLVAPVWRWWRSEDRAPTSTWLVPVAVGFAAALFAWSGPLWDVATNSPNNVEKLIANFSEPSEDPIGIGRGIEAVLQSADPVGPWVWGGAEVTGSALPGLVFVGLWAAVAAVVAWRRRDPSLTRLNVVLATVTVLGALAVSRVFGQLYLYTFRWIVAIVALQVFTLGWGLVTLASRPSAVWQRRFAALGAVALVGLSLVMSVRLVRQEIPYDQSWRAEQVLAPAVADQLDPDLRYLVIWDDPAYLGGLGHGLILDLERRGFTVGGEPRFDAAIEPHRVMCPGDFDATLLVVTGERNVAEARATPGLTQIASVDPREDPVGWEATFDELVEVLQEEEDPDTTPESLERSLNLLLLAPGFSDRVTDLAAELVLDGVPSAVFLDERDPADLGFGEGADFGTTQTSNPCFR